MRRERRRIVGDQQLLARRRLDAAQSASRGDDRRAARHRFQHLQQLPRPRAHRRHRDARAGEPGMHAIDVALHFDARIAPREREDAAVRTRAGDRQARLGLFAPDVRQDVIGEPADRVDVRKISKIAGEHEPPPIARPPSAGT